MYGRKAAEVSEQLRLELGEFEMSVNPNKPRSKSFEISIIKDNDDGILHVCVSLFVIEVII